MPNPHADTIKALTDPKVAKTLLDRGHIKKETYDLLMKKAGTAVENSKKQADKEVQTAYSGEKVGVPDSAGAASDINQLIQSSEAPANQSVAASEETTDHVTPPPTSDPIAKQQLMINATRAGQSVPEFLAAHSDRAPAEDPLTSQQAVINATRAGQSVPEMKAAQAGGASGGWGDSTASQNTPSTGIEKASDGNMQGGPTYRQAFDAMNPGYNDMIAGAKAAQAAGINEGIKSASLLSAAAQTMQDQAKTEALLQSRNSDDLNNARDTLSRKIDDFQATSQVDPNKYWSNRSTAQKIMSGIGVALGGLGGGPNQGLQVIDNAINRDIEAQKANINSKQAGIGMQQGLYKDMLAEFGDERAARAATRAAYLTQVQTQLQAVASKYKGQAIAANAQMSLGQIENAKSQAQQQFMQAIQFSSQQMNTDDDTRRILAAQPLLERAGIKPGDALKQLDQYKQTQNDKSLVDSTVEKLGKMQTVGYRAENPFQAGSRIDNLNGQLFNLVMKNVDSKRVTPESMKQEFEPFLIHFKDDAETRQQKADGIKNLMDIHAPDLQAVKIAGVMKPDVQGVKPWKSNGR